VNCLGVCLIPGGKVLRSAGPRSLAVISVGEEFVYP
jgi:hypothetical protein